MKKFIQILKNDYNFMTYIKVLVKIITLEMNFLNVLFELESLLKVF